MGVPQRTCLGCGRKDDKARLLRLAMQDGALVADPGQRLPGRGVYCCPNPVCYQRLGRQGKRLTWALRLKAAVGPLPKLSFDTEEPAATDRC